MTDLRIFVIRWIGVVSPRVSLLEQNRVVWIGDDHLLCPADDEDEGHDASHRKVTRSSMCSGFDVHSLVEAHHPVHDKFWKDEAVRKVLECWLHLKADRTSHCKRGIADRIWAQVDLVRSTVSVVRGKPDNMV